MKPNYVMYLRLCVFELLSFDNAFDVQTDWALYTIATHLPGLGYDSIPVTLQLLFFIITFIRSGRNITGAV